MHPHDLHDQSFLVTGASSGIGLAVVELLATRGARVIAAARSAERAGSALDAVRARVPHARISFLHLDVADFSSVRRAAAQVLSESQGLDVLVNNAGVAVTSGVSPDGFDLTYATNHLGPFLLTNLLLPRIREAPHGRIVNVSSKAHLSVRRINWSGLERSTTPTTGGLGDYAQSKLMNVIHAKELALRLAGTSVRTSSLHPGVVASNVWRAAPRPMQWFFKLFMLSNAEGAATPLYCATAPELNDVSGRYYDKSREARCNPLADDPANGTKLWASSEAATALVRPADG